MSPVTYATVKNKIIAVIIICGEAKEAVIFGCSMLLCLQFSNDTTHNNEQQRTTKTTQQLESIFKSTGTGTTEHIILQAIVPTYSTVQYSTVQYHRQFTTVYAQAQARVINNKK